MAKVLTIKDPESGITYTLEYTRSTIAQMERNGFVADELSKKPMTNFPALFAGAFLAHHRFVKRDTIEGIFARMTQRDKLFEKLVEMYNEPIVSLLAEPDEDADSGNLTWAAEW